MANLEHAFNEVIASTSATQVDLGHTDWLNDRQIDEIEALESEYEAAFERHLSEARERFGPPVLDDRSDRDAVDAWYAEALRFAGWPHRDGLVFLALEHHDRETPIALLVGYVSHGEIVERSA
jgi:hypothetical protein